MACSSYTPNLGLCAWQSDDRPKRMDFVNDNNIIDSALGQHINDDSIHITNEQKELISAPYTVVTYVGDGNSQKSINLDKTYKYAIVFQKYYPSVTLDSNGKIVSHFAIVGRIFGFSSDAELKTNSLVVKQGQSINEEVITNLNEFEGQYVALLFK